MVLTEKQKLVIPSKPENLVLIEKLVEDVCDLFDVNEEIYGHILVVLTETFNNALEHGNKLNPDKQITITFKIKSDKLIFTVKDEGLGFDYFNIADPTEPHNISKSKGRGIFLMKQLSDNIYFEDNGSTVIMEFNLR